MSTEAPNKSMENCISYSLFGYHHGRYENSFDFDSYLRNLCINVRVNRILYPNWINVINLEEQTYDSPYRPIFHWFQSNGFIEINICENNQPLCKAMLWRLKPMFVREGTDGGWRFKYTLCRDADSVGTYREAQAVNQWIEEGKVLHCITDSISHNIPMMGGMIGFMQGFFSDRVSCHKWDQLMDLAGDINFNIKSSDQQFLNKNIYPHLADSSTEHFVLGMKQTIPEGDGRHYSIPDIDINVDRKFQEPLNACAGHIGAAGYYETPMVNFLRHIDPYREDYAEIEKQFPKIFYWR